MSKSWLGCRKTDCRSASGDDQPAGNKKTSVSNVTHWVPLDGSSALMMRICEKLRCWKMSMTSVKGAAERMRNGNF